MAIQQGSYVARLMAREVRSATPVRRESFAESVEGRSAASTAGNEPRGEERPQFEYWHKGQLAVIGRGRAVCAVGPFQFSGLVAWLIWALVHLYYLLGFRNRAIVMLEWTLFHAIGRHRARIMIDEPLPAAPSGR